MRFDGHEQRSGGASGAAGRRLSQSYLHDAYLREDAVREALPRPAALAMPRQRLTADKSVGFALRTPDARDSIPDTSPVNIVRRRVIFFGSAIALTTAALAAPVIIYARSGFEPLQAVALLLLGVLLLSHLRLVLQRRGRAGGSHHRQGRRHGEDGAGSACRWVAAPRS